MKPLQPSLFSFPPQFTILARIVALELEPLARRKLNNIFGYSLNISLAACHFFFVKQSWTNRRQIRFRPTEPSLQFYYISDMMDKFVSVFLF